MQNGFTWKKGIFSDTYKVYSTSRQIAVLKNNPFTVSSVGEINGKSYTFKTKGVFSPRTEIIDNSGNFLVGEITYNSWMTKAFLSVNQSEYTWKYENVWNTKWSIYAYDKAIISYKSSSASGQIISAIDNDLLMLTGLYAANYYRQLTIIILVAVFTPIFAATR